MKPILLLLFSGLTLVGGKTQDSGLKIGSFKGLPAESKFLAGSKIATK